MAVEESPGVQVKTSPVEGLGLFATRPYPAGARIRRVNIVREVTERAPLDASAGERAEHCGYAEGRVLLWGFPDRHVNHSCDPNAYELYAEDGIYIVARRAIDAGEEITFDYNVNNGGGDSWPCNCGAARCRGETLGSYFRLPAETQREYSALLAPWFIARHRDALGKLVQGSG